MQASGVRHEVEIIMDISFSNKKRIIVLISLVALIGLALFFTVGKTAQKVPSDEKLPTGETKNMPTGSTKVLLKTNMGDITIEMYSDMPITTGNFVKLVNQKFYNGVIFHRVIDGFMLQGGDPTGTGRGGPGYTIQDEFTTHNRNDRGTISMANAGPNTGGSQFFINLVGNNFLDTKHPAFGKVVSGMDVVDKIAKVKTDSGDRPLQEVKIISASVV